MGTQELCEARGNDGNGGGGSKCLCGWDSAGECRPRQTRARPPMRKTSMVLPPPHRQGGDSSDVSKACDDVTDEMCMQNARLPCPTCLPLTPVPLTDGLRDKAKVLKDTCVGKAPGRLPAAFAKLAAICCVHREIELVTQGCAANGGLQTVTPWSECVSSGVGMDMDVSCDDATTFCAAAAGEVAMGASPQVMWDPVEGYGRKEDGSPVYTEAEEAAMKAKNVAAMQSNLAGIARCTGQPYLAGALASHASAGPLQKPADQAKAAKCCAHTWLDADGKLLPSGVSSSPRPDKAFRCVPRVRRVLVPGSHPPDSEWWRDKTTL